MTPLYSTKGQVYFVQPVDGGLIKIGLAKNTASRLRELQWMSPVPLQLLGVIREGNWPMEQRLHRQFADLREHGEWFRPAPELLAYIAEHAMREEEAATT